MKEKTQISKALLEQVLKVTGLKLTQVSKRTGIPRPTLQSILSENNRELSATTFLKLSCLISSADFRELYLTFREQLLAETSIPLVPTNV